MKSHNFNNCGNRIGIFVIAYNAESHIEATLDRIPEEIWQSVTVVYVIDDCSTDETVERALSFRRSGNKLVVLRNHVNKMYGGNQKLGCQYAVDNTLDVIVMLHADGQYAPECLERLLTPIVENDADVVIGSRMLEKRDALKGGMPIYKFLGNIILTKIQNSLCKMTLSEFHSGYRAYNTSFLKSIPFWENTDDWHFDTEILLQARQRNCRIQEVPIPTYYGREICRVNGIRYGLNCILTSFRYCLFCKKLFYCRNFDINVNGQRYLEKFNDPFTSHSIIYNKLKLHNLEGKRVLELGVGDASLTKKMFEKGAIVDAVEMDAISSELANPYCQKVYKMDIENIGKADIKDQYDIIVAADILEHLRDPELVLSKLKTYLKTGGLLIISLPNVANIYVRLNILFGRFPYHTKGILDKTHLHFYTLKTAELLLIKTGWIIESRGITSIPLCIVFPFLTRHIFILKFFFGLTKMWKGLLAYQSIFYCTNPNKKKMQKNKPPQGCCQTRE